MLPLKIKLSLRFPQLIQKVKWDLIETELNPKVGTERVETFIGQLVGKIVLCTMFPAQGNPQASFA